MAGSSGSLKLTAWVDNKASGPLQAIGNEAKRMGEGFSKSAAALHLVSSAAGEMGGQVAGAAGKVTSLAGLLTQGPFGVGIAAATLAVGAFSLAWRTFTAESETIEAAIKQIDSAISGMATASAKQKEELRKLSEEVRFFGMSAAEATLFKNDERLSAIDQEMQRNEDVIKALVRKKVAQGELEDIDQKQIDALRAANAAMYENAQTIRATSDNIQRKIDLEFMEEERVRASTEATKGKTKAIKAQAEADKEAADLARSRLATVNEFYEAEKRNNERNTRAQLDSLREADEAKVRIEEKSANERKKIEEDLADEKERMQQQVASAVADAVSLMVSASLSGSGKQREAAIAAARAQIAASIAKAAIEAIAAHAGVPFVGVVLGAAAAAGIVALASKYDTGFAHGGTVRGGVKGRDSVNIMAQDGEAVIPVSLASGLRDVLNSNGPRSSSGGSAFASGGTVRSSGRSMAHGINVTFNSTLPPSNLETRRAARALKREMKTLAARGVT